jgi:hypothetical protein
MQEAACNLAYVFQHSLSCSREHRQKRSHSRSCEHSQKQQPLLSQLATHSAAFTLQPHSLHMVISRCMVLAVAGAGSKLTHIHIH